MCPSRRREPYGPGWGLTIPTPWGITREQADDRLTAKKPRPDFKGHVVQALQVSWKYKVKSSGGRVARQWPAKFPLAGGSCQVSGQYQAGAARQHLPVDPASIPPEQLASLVLLNVQKGRWKFGVEVSRMRRNLL